MSQPISIVMLASPGDSTNIVYNALAKAYRVTQVVLEDPVPRTQLLRRRVKRLGLRVVAGQVIFQGAVMPILRRRSRARLLEIKLHEGLDDAPIPIHAIRRVSSANAQETVTLLKELRPSIVVVNGTRILSKSLLQAVPARFLNTHAGITPLYRGVHGGYWALANDDTPSCGVTVHLVDEGIDTGSILGQTRIRPTQADNFATYPYLQLAAALPLLLESVRNLSEGKVLVLPPPPGRSRLWSHPTIGQYLWHRVRRNVR